MSKYELKKAQQAEEAARKEANFEAELAEIKATFPTKRILTVSDVMKYTGRGRDSVMNMYGIDPKRGISVIALARLLS